MPTRELVPTREPPSIDEPGLVATAPEPGAPLLTTLPLLPELAEPVEAALPAPTRLLFGALAVPKALDTPLALLLVLEPELPDALVPAVIEPVP